MIFEIYTLKKYVLIFLQIFKCFILVTLPHFVAWRIETKKSTGSNNITVMSNKTPYPYHSHHPIMISILTTLSGMECNRFKALGMILCSEQTFWVRPMWFLCTLLCTPVYDVANVAIGTTQDNNNHCIIFSTTIVTDWVCDIVEWDDQEGTGGDKKQRIHDDQRWKIPPNINII